MTPPARNEKWTHSIDNIPLSFHGIWTFYKRSSIHLANKISKTNFVHIKAYAIKKYLVKMLIFDQIFIIFVFDYNLDKDVIKDVLFYNPN